MRWLQLLAIGVACLPACERKTIITEQSAPVQELSLRLGQDFREAYDQAIRHGARDWSDSCGYKYGFGFGENMAEPRRKRDVRHLDLPNGMLMTLFYLSKQKLISDSEAWNAVSYDDCFLDSIVISNSRILRSIKSEVTHPIVEFHQSALGETRATGFVGDDDSHYLYVGMSAETARRLIRLHDISVVSTNQAELQPVLPEINRARRGSSFKMPPDLKLEGLWETARLPGGEILYIQCGKAGADDLIESLICKPKASIAERSYIEVELINMVKPRLNKWEDPDSSAAPEAAE